MNLKHQKLEDFKKLCEHRGLKFQINNNGIEFAIQCANSNVLKYWPTTGSFYYFDNHNFNSEKGKEQDAAALLNKYCDKVKGVASSEVTHELSFKVTWRPVLGRKTVEQELALVKAHIENMLCDEGVSITDVNVLKLR